MLERRKLNKLIVLTLQHSEIHPKASELYGMIKEKRPEILKEETVRGFRSFVKIINSFEQIEIIGSGVKQYTLKKDNGITK